MGGEGSRGAGIGQAGGVISSEKLKNHKNSTHSKIKFNIIFIFFLSAIDIKNFQKGLGAG